MISTELLRCYPFWVGLNGYVVTLAQAADEINVEYGHNFFHEGDEFLMTQKAAQIVRERLRDMRIESLAFHLC